MEESTLTPPSRGRRLLNWLARSALLSLISGVSYLAVFYATFPGEELRAKIMTEARKNHLDLRIGEVHPSGFSALKFEGLSIATLEEKKSTNPRRGRLRGRARAAADSDAEAEATPEPTPTPTSIQEGKTPFLNLDQLTTSVSVLPLLKPGASRSVDIGVDADLYGGTLEGEVGLSEEKTRVDLDLSALDLALYPFESDAYHLKAQGFLAMAADLDLSKANYRESTGTVQMAVQGMKILKESTVKGFDLPVELAFTESVMNLEVAEGKAQIKDLRFTGEALNIEGDGSIYLNNDLTRARLNVKVRLKFGAGLEAAALVLPSSARDDDGWYHYIISGRITDPRVRPDRASARRAGKSKGSPTDALPEDDGGFPNPLGDMDSGRPPGVSSVPGSSGLSDEELEKRREDRRKLAEERRARREERLKRLREARARRETGEEGEMQAPFVGPDGDGRGIRPPFPGGDFPPAAPPEEIVRARRGNYDNAPPEPGEIQDPMPIDPPEEFVPEELMAPPDEFQDSEGGQKR